jgi:hypothetical protein
MGSALLAMTSASPMLLPVTQNEKLNQLKYFVELFEIRYFQLGIPWTTQKMVQRDNKSACRNFIFWLKK